MYNNKLVVCVKAGGQILRENGDTIFLPFNTEYSLYFKNLNSTRVQFSLNVDGQNATEDCYLVIEPGREMTLERFIKNGNMNSGNRFKFIERSASVEQHRGIGAEDGLIHIEFEFEQPYVQPISYRPNRTPDWIYNQNNFLGGQLRSKDLGAVAPRGIVDNSFYNSTCSYDSNVRGVEISAQNVAGITVPGSISTQQFHETQALKTDGVKHSIVLRLLGEIQNKIVQRPVTVKHKPTCVTCGRRNKATARFCTNCGTNLQLI
jgi:hypothetical protein